MDRGKDEIIRIKIEDMSDKGEGIGKADGFTWFVKDTVPGDLAEARVTRVKKKYGYAESIRILTPSPGRVMPRCPYFAQCGGCQLQAMDYGAQPKFKEDLVKNQLKRIGGVNEADELVRPVIGMEDPWRYRDNEQFYPAVDEYGKTVFGFYAGRTHEVTDQDDCQVGIKENFTILKSIINYMDKYHVRPCAPNNAGGTIGRVQIRKGFATGDIMVCLDIHGPLSALREPWKLTEDLCSLFPESDRQAHITSVCAHMTDDSSIVSLYGPGSITDKIGGLEFQISPLSFYQVNPLQTERLYGTVLDFARLTGTETVWDLYCGIGTISLFLARQAEHVYGVETVPQAVDDARLNAERNGIKNVGFYAGKAEEVLPWQFGRNHIHADVIVLDPPRRGCDRACLDTIIDMKPSRIVYVSCDCATLARDIRILREGGYGLKAVQPVDMFPQSVHTEAVALLAIDPLID